MILPDINLLLYAYDKFCPQNSTASSWWSNCLSGMETVGLPHSVALAIEHHAILHTSDADFIRFSGLRWLNPITDIPFSSTNPYRLLSKSIE